MADKKISDLSSGAPAQGTDAVPIARAGANFKLSLSDLGTAIGGGDTLHTVAASTAALTVDETIADVWDITLTANCTFTIPSVTSGIPTSLTLILRQDATGSRTITWPASVKWVSSHAPVIQTGATAIDFIVLETVDGGTNWYGWYENGGGPGSEIGYDQITGIVTVSSTTEATGTLVLTASSYVFDGGAVIAHFFSPGVRPDSATAGSSIFVCLFEGSTEIGRFGVCENPAGGGHAQFLPFNGHIRFTPSAGPHTYKVTSFMDIGTSGAVVGGASGTGGYPPAFLRFTKV